MSLEEEKTSRGERPFSTSQEWVSRALSKPTISPLALKVPHVGISGNQRVEMDDSNGGSVNAR